MALDTCPWWTNKIRSLVDCYPAGCRKTGTESQYQDTLSSIAIQSARKSIASIAPSTRHLVRSKRLPWPLSKAPSNQSLVVSSMAHLQSPFTQDQKDSRRHSLIYHPVSTSTALWFTFKCHSIGVSGRLPFVAFLLSFLSILNPLRKPLSIERAWIWNKACVARPACSERRFNRQTSCAASRIPGSILDLAQIWPRA